MTEEHIVTLVAAVIASGLLTTLVNWILHRVDRRDEQRQQLMPSDSLGAMRFGVETLLFQQLEAIHTHAMQEGYCDDELKRVADRTYQAYHQLGGNGVGTAMWDDVMKSSSTPKLKTENIGTETKHV